jgi:hypothetical protein
MANRPINMALSKRGACLITKLAVMLVMQVHRHDNAQYYLPSMQAAAGQAGGKKMLSALQAQRKIAPKRMYFKTPAPALPPRRCEAGIFLVTG